MQCWTGCMSNVGLKEYGEICLQMRGLQSFGHPERIGENA